MLHIDEESAFNMGRGIKETYGLLGAYVDNNLIAGKEKFDKLIELIARSFESKPIEHENSEFVGIHIEIENILMASERSAPINYNLLPK